MSSASRLFFAFWPDDQLAGRLGRIAGWCVHDAGGRKVPTRNLHLTLLFLGEVTATQQEALEETASRLAIPPLTLTLGQVEFWPRAKILCLTGDDDPPDPGLLELVDTLRRSAKIQGLRVEDRPYRPHVTLARKVSRLAEPPRLEPVTWALEGLCLVESVPERGRYRYRVLREW
jgi:2'-5' RNA ligase